MATIEFKNEATSKTLMPLYLAIVAKQENFKRKCSRIVFLQKSGLCSVPIEPETEEVF